MRLLSNEFIVHDCAPQAAAKFVGENDEQAIRAFVGAGMAYFVAEQHNAIAGFIAIRDNKHLFHMFVDKPYHRQGIAKAMWAVARQAALDAGNPGLFTVNASHYAVPAYEALGFVRTGPVQCKNGLSYNPMQLGGAPA